MALLEKPVTSDHLHALLDEWGAKHTAILKACTSFARHKLNSDAPTKRVRKPTRFPQSNPGTAWPAQKFSEGLGLCAKCTIHRQPTCKLHWIIPSSTLTQRPRESGSTSLD